MMIPDKKKISIHHKNCHQIQLLQQHQPAFLVEHPTQTIMAQGFVHPCPLKDDGISGSAIWSHFQITITRWMCCTRHPRAPDIVVGLQKRVF